MIRVLPLIIRREFNARIRNRTFRIMTFVSPVLMIAMLAVIISLRVVQPNQHLTIAYVDNTGMFDASVFANTAQFHFRDYSTFSLQKAKKLVELEQLEALIYLPKRSPQDTVVHVQWFARETLHDTIIDTFRQKIAARVTLHNLATVGIDPDVIEKQQAKVTIDLHTFSGTTASTSVAYVKMFFGGAAGYLLMMFIIIYGNMIMRSVIEEKTNRIVEIIVSSVPPVHLMLGKIIGTSLAGITQFVIWIGVGGILFFGIQWYFTTEMTSSFQYLPKDYELLFTVFRDIENLPLLIYSMFFLLYFIFGYFLYSAIYAAIGAAVDSETDAQQFRFPIMIPLMFAIYVGFFSVLQDPHSMLSITFSMVPLTSPVVMLMRIPFGVPWWEIVLSVLILLASIAFTVGLAAKIYKIGILNYGKKPTYKELFRWLKY